MIVLDKISKFYDTFPALSDISFTMERGDVVGLLGVNGAGKSTLMKILAGIVPADSGCIRFFGKDYLSNSLEVKKQIGYLFEDNPLYEDMYVREYLEYVAGIYGVSKDRIFYLIEQVGLKNEYKKKIKILSKGNRQRVGIAQALINDPLFLIMDEPTNGLDPKQRESLNNLFTELSKEKVILLSTHLLHEVQGLCSQFVLIDKGRIITDQRVEHIESIENTFHKLTNENNS